MRRNVLRTLSALTKSKPLMKLQLVKIVYSSMSGHLTMLLAPYLFLSGFMVVAMGLGMANRI